MFEQLILSCDCVGIPMRAAETELAMTTTDTAGVEEDKEFAGGGEGLVGAEGRRLRRAHNLLWGKFKIRRCYIFYHFFFDFPWGHKKQQIGEL